MADHRFNVGTHRFIIRVQRNGLVQVWRDFSSNGKKMEAIMVKSRRDKAFANLRLAIACQEGMSDAV